VSAQGDITRMPYKICPSCSNKCGPRTLKCKCGHSFQQNKNNKPSDALISGGAWIADWYNDAKSVPEPDPLPRNRKLSVGEVKQYVEYNGVGFCIYCYIPPAKIEDKKLANRWEKARSAMKEVIEYLYKI